MYPSTCFVGTGASSNLISMSFIPLQWCLKICYGNLPDLQTARHALENFGTIFLHISIRDLCTRVWFGNAESLAVNVIFCKRYIDKLIKGIFPMERLVVPIHWRDVAIIPFYPTPLSTVDSASNYAEHGTRKMTRNPQMSNWTRMSTILSMSLEFKP